MCTKSGLEVIVDEVIKRRVIEGVKTNYRIIMVQVTLKDKVLNTRIVIG